MSIAVLKNDLTYADRAELLTPWYQAVTWPDGSKTDGWEVDAKVAALTRGVTLEGKRVHDVGCMAGIATKWLEQAGANASGSDVHERCEQQFALVKEVFGLQAEHTRWDCCGLPELGHWDVVLMMGVYYHLRDWVQGIDACWAAADEVLLIEGEVVEGGWALPPGAAFYPGEYKGDDSNWWVPTVQGLYEVCQTLPGVQQVEVLFPFYGGCRAGVRCFR